MRIQATLKILRVHEKTIPPKTLDILPLSENISSPKMFRYDLWIPTILRAEKTRWKTPPATIYSGRIPAPESYNCQTYSIIRKGISEV
jgi:hypothetical protein